jgi:uncharacterized membrane protein YsdA (DUF1294 family)/cold shock CspA family protein
MNPGGIAAAPAAQRRERADMLHKGKITNWNDDKGFGFITPNSGGDRVFIHIKAFSVRNVRPEVGDVVVYSITKDDKGRFQAVNAKFVADKQPQRSTRPVSWSAIVFALMFFAAVGYAVSVSEVHEIFLIAYAALSAITFLAYAVDKSAAQAGRWRTKENTLHLLSLVGGWPGALLAQQTLRHKSRKTSFRIVFWITVLLNGAAVVWLHTSEGRRYFSQLLELAT